MLPDFKIQELHNGEARILPRGQVETYQTAEFLPDGRRIVFVGAEHGHPQRIWIQELPAGALIATFFVTRDMRSYAYGYFRILDDLYLVEGLR